MTDAPERIWAVPEYNCTVYMSGNSPITAQNGPFTHHRHGAAAKYIRADLVEALEAENHRLRYVLDGVAAAIDTGRNEPLQIWRDQIEIARAAITDTPQS